MSCYKHGCSRSAVTAGINDGKFGRWCGIHWHNRLELSSLADYRRKADRQDYAKDALQPFINNKPNPEFVEAYPEQVADYYENEDITKIVRDF